MWTYILYTFSTYLPHMIKEILYIEKTEIILSFASFLVSKFRKRLTPEEEEYELMSDWIELPYRTLSSRSQPRPELVVGYD